MNTSRFAEEINEIRERQRQQAAATASASAISPHSPSQPTPPHQYHSINTAAGPATHTSPVPNAIAQHNFNTDMIIDKEKAIVRRDRDIAKLLDIVVELTKELNSHQFEAVKLLKADVERREALVADRENRVWGWRLAATRRDEEIDAEFGKLEERELDLVNREKQLVDREALLIQREKALEHRTIALNEEYQVQLRQLKDEVARMRRKSVLPSY